jgi:pilus assembly protein Flp/PilA
MENPMRATIRRFQKDRSGATAIEYGLIAALISLAILTGVGSAGNSIASLWNDNANEVVDALNN